MRITWLGFLDRTPLSRGEQSQPHPSHASKQRNILDLQDFQLGLSSGVPNLTRTTGVDASVGNPTDTSPGRRRVTHRGGAGFGGVAPAAVELLTARGNRDGRNYADFLAAARRLWKRLFEVQPECPALRGEENPHRLSPAVTHPSDLPDTVIAVLFAQLAAAVAITLAALVL